MMEDIKNSRIKNNHKHICSLFSVFVMNMLKMLHILFFLNIHKHFKTQHVFDYHIPPSCPQGFGDLLRK